MLSGITAHDAVKRHLQIDVETDIYRKRDGNEHQYVPQNFRYHELREPIVESGSRNAH